MMYHYWVAHGIRPSVIYNMPKGELRVIMAFFEREMQTNAKINKDLAEG